jgi:predicted RNA-binding Zn ribbon-like protein
MFSHDTEQSLQTVVDLVNTRPGQRDAERLASVEQLAAFVAAHHISGVSRLSPDDLTAVREVRSRFAEVFGVGDADGAAALINKLLSEAPVQPRLSNHDGYAWHVHYFAPGASLADHLAVDGGMALAQVVALDEIDRLSVCDAPDCEGVLVDLSRNRSKRYCDAQTCGNRLHVAAYRQRRRSEQHVG